MAAFTLPFELEVVPVLLCVLDAALLEVDETERLPTN